MGSAPPVAIVSAEQSGKSPNGGISPMPYGRKGRKGDFSRWQEWLIFKKGDAIAILGSGSRSYMVDCALDDFDPQHLADCLCRSSVNIFGCRRP